MPVAAQFNIAIVNKALCRFICLSLEIVRLRVIG